MRLTVLPGGLSFDPYLAGPPILSDVSGGTDAWAHATGGVWGLNRSVTGHSVAHRHLLGRRLWSSAGPHCTGPGTLVVPLLVRGLALVCPVRGVVSGTRDRPRVKLITLSGSLSFDPYLTGHPIYRAPDLSGVSGGTDAWTRTAVAHRVLVRGFAVEVSQARGVEQYSVPECGSPSCRVVCPSIRT